MCVGVFHSLGHHSPCPSTSTCCARVRVTRAREMWEGALFGAPQIRDQRRPTHPPHLPTHTAKGGDLAAVRASQAARFANPATVDAVVELDEKWREAKAEAETLQMEFNKVVKEIGNLRKVGWVMCMVACVWIGGDGGRGNTQKGHQHARPSFPAHTGQTRHHRPPGTDQDHESRHRGRVSVCRGR